MPAAPAAEDAADERVTAKIRAVLAAIALKGSDERWEAVARLRLFCEGASSAEELEEIGSKKWPTLRTLVELLDELSGAPGADAAEARALDDVVWLLVRAASARSQPPIARIRRSPTAPPPYAAWRARGARAFPIGCPRA